MMATFFGEILPVISRAAIDEEDDELSPQPKPLSVLKTLLGKESIVSCDCLVITVGEVAWRFVESFYSLSPENKLADIEETPDDDQFGVETVSKLPKMVPDGKRRTVFAACKGHTPPEQIWPLTNKIMDFTAEHKEVFVLSSSPVQEYKCDDQTALGAPSVRSLSTPSPPNQHPIFPTLEQPNMFKNIVAAVLSTCLIRQTPAVAYVCYTENIHTDISSILAFHQLLETPQFHTTKNLKVASKEILHWVRNSNSGHDGLYV